MADDCIAATATYNPGSSGADFHVGGVPGRELANMLKSMLLHLGPWQRYLFGYVLLLSTGTTVVVLLRPEHWPVVASMWIIAILAGWGVARRGGNSLRRQIRRLREAADAIGRGELDHRIDLHRQDDFAKLADSLDRMAARLEGHLREREALQKELARVERLALIGELGATVAHEVNNPLDGLQNAVRILRRQHADHEQTRGLLDLMESGLVRIERMVQRLLGLVHSEPLRLEPVRAEEALDDALLFVRPRLNRNGIKVSRDFPPEPLMVRADRMQLAQVLINVMLNSADAMPEGGQLSIAGRDGGDPCRAVLEIADTGGGIKPAALARVFEPFYTTKRNGTGLGLAVVARIMEAHQGRIDLESEPGRGTRVRIELPTVQSEREEARPEVATPA